MSGFSYKPASLDQTPLFDGTSVYGHLYSTTITQTTRADFTYGINAKLFASSTHGVSAGAMVTEVDGVVSCSSGTAVTGSARIRTRAISRLQPGQGMSGRLTTVFATGTAGNFQQCAMNNIESGYAFAYSGVNFGLLWVDSAAREIRKFTITAASGNRDSNIYIERYSIITTFNSWWKQCESDISKHLKQ